MLGYIFIFRILQEIWQPKSKQHHYHLLLSPSLHFLHTLFLSPFHPAWYYSLWLISLHLNAILLAFRLIASVSTILGKYLMLFLSSTFACYVLGAVDGVGLHSSVSLFVCVFVIYCWFWLHMLFMRCVYDGAVYKLVGACTILNLFNSSIRWADVSNKLNLLQELRNM